MTSRYITWSGFGGGGEGYEGAKTAAKPSMPGGGASKICSSGAAEAFALSTCRQILVCYSWSGDQIRVLHHRMHLVVLANPQDGWISPNFDKFNFA